MKRYVTIQLWIDPAEYLGAEDTPEGTIDLVFDCLEGGADWACNAKVSCGDRSKEFDLE